MKVRSRIPQKRAKPRRGPMRDVGYRQWCCEQPCVVSGIKGDTWIVSGSGLWRRAIIDPAHTQNNGMGSKGPDSSCVPLERAYHREYDAGRKAFEKRYVVNMKQLAEEHYARYQSTQERRD